FVKSTFIIFLIKFILLSAIKHNPVITHTFNESGRIIQINEGHHISSGGRQDASSLKPYPAVHTFEVYGMSRNIRRKCHLYVTRIGKHHIVIIVIQGGADGYVPPVAHYATKRYITVIVRMKENVTTF